MAKIYYLRGAIDNENLLPEHNVAISELLRGNYASRDLEKLKGHEVYSFRLNNRARLLFSLRVIAGQTYLVVLDYLPTHDYHKSRFLNAQILKNYRERHAQAEEEAVRDGFVFEALTNEQQTQVAAASHSDSGELEYGIADYYYQNLIELNLEQQQAMTMPLPAIISGIAGSGKSCVSMSLLLSYLQAHPEVGVTEPPLLYVSQSQELVDMMRNTWLELPLAEGKPERIHFMTYHALLQSAGHTHPRVGEEAFQRWYKTYVRDQHVLAASEETLTWPDAETAYQECRIASVYTKEAYQNLGARQSFLPQTGPLRAFLYEALQQYRVFLKKTAQIDPALQVWQSDKQYAFVAVDEAQDFSHLELEQIGQLAEDRSVVFCLDSHQRLFDRRSVRPFLLQHFQIKEESYLELNVTYRCPVKIVAAANAVIRFKQSLAGGLADKHEVTHLTSARQSGLGYLYVLNPEQLPAQAWLMAQAHHTHCAIVTDKTRIEEAKNYFKTPLVFTPESIKGLEYPVVIAYKLYNHNLFREAASRLKDVDLRASRKNRPKAHAQDERFGPDFNRIYTAYTRAQQLLVVCERPEKNYRLLLDALQALANQEPPSDACLQLQNSVDDWQQQMHTQLAANNQAIAEAIFITKLGGTPEMFQALVSSLRAPDMPPSLGEASTSAAVEPGQQKAIQPQQPHTNKKKKKRESAASSAVKPIQPLSSKQQATAASAASTSAASPIISSQRTQLDRAAEDLANDFTVKRLKIVLSLFGESIWLQSYNKLNGEKPILADLLRQPVNLDVFTNVLVNHAGLLAKTPLNTLIDYLNKNNGRKVSKEIEKILSVQTRYKRLASKELIIDDDATPAYVAAQYGQDEVLLVLHALGANLNQANNDGETPAHIAAQKGHVEALRILKGLGANLNQARKDGATPAYIAAHEGQVDVLRVLNELGADLNKANSHGATPAFIAAETGQVDALRILKALGADLNHPMNDGATPAYIAAQNGHVDVLRVLNELGADLNHPMNDGATPAHIAAQNGHVDVLLALKALGANLNQAMNDGVTPALIAAEIGHVEALRVLKTLGADLNQADNDGVTPAYIAAQEGHVDVLRVLNESGVDLNQATNDGATPAYIAAQEGHVDALRVLNALGADLNQANNDSATPVYIAAQTGQVDALRVLNKLGADLNQARNNGATPAHIAAQKGHVDVLRVLNELGVDLNQATNDGATPAYIAAQEGHVDALRVLNALGADLNQAMNDGTTPAFIAAQHGKLLTLRMLIDEQVDLHQKFRTNKASLIQFSQNYSIEIQQNVLSKTKSYDDTSTIELSPLEIAEIMGHTEIVQLLSQRNAPAPRTLPKEPASVVAALSNLSTRNMVPEPCPYLLAENTFMPGDLTRFAGQVELAAVYQRYVSAYQLLNPTLPDSWPPFNDIHVLRSRDNSIGVYYSPETTLFGDEQHIAQESVVAKQVGYRLLTCAAYFLSQHIPVAEVPKTLKLAMAICHDNTHWTGVIVTIDSFQAAYQTLFQNTNLSTAACSDIVSFNKAENDIYRQLGISLDDPENHKSGTPELEKIERIVSFFKSTGSIAIEHYDSLNSSDYHQRIESGLNHIRGLIDVQSCPCSFQQGHTCGDHTTINLFARGMMGIVPVINEDSAVSSVTSASLRAFTDHVESPQSIEHAKIIVSSIGPVVPVDSRGLLKVAAPGFFAPIPKPPVKHHELISASGQKPAENSTVFSPQS